MNSRELVLANLEFKNTNGRVPRDLWLLPWAEEHFPDQIADIKSTYPADIIDFPVPKKDKGIARGNMYELGESIDSWGCKFENIHRGIIGEVKEPLVKDDDWEDVDNIHIPEDWLSFDIDEMNQQLEQYSDKFTLGGLVRPFEQLQFIRGTENFYIDLMMRPTKMLEFMEKMHDFYCRYLTKLAQTNVDALWFMDDWGSQTSLLINPTTWREFFRPMYKDFIEIAHSHGKKAFMHSDGNIISIIPELIDIGLDALNSQIFCIGVENLKQFRGKINFWGEIDRQHLLVHGTKQQIQDAVHLVYDTLWQDGGCIAQCEFGAGANPDNVKTIYETWDAISNK